MEIHLDIARTVAQFDQILALQRANLFDAVDPAERQRSGFVYARHTRALLERMAAHLPQVIAVCGDRVVGYTLAMPVAMRDALPELVPMFAQFDRTLYRGRPLPDYRYMVGGQICVAREHRGKGLLRRLYQETRHRVYPAHELCVTEVSHRNPVSLAAHLNMGFESIASYEDGTDRWEVVAWDLARKGDGAH